MDDDEVEELAGRLRTARRERRTLTALSDTRPLTLADAYRIQSRLVTARLADGERRIGWKLGYTSRAMREQMGVDAPNFGPLTDVMLLPDGSRVPSVALQPRVEPEIAVVLGERAPDLAERLAARPGAAGNDGGAPEPDGEDALDLVAATVSGVHAALEVVDSIWTGYRFRLEDNTADGSSAAWFVLGPQLPPGNLPEIRVDLESSSGRLTGRGADADGHPLRGVAWLARQLAARGERFAPGDVVITGGLTRAVPLDAAVRARFTTMDGVGVEVAVLPPA